MKKFNLLPVMVFLCFAVFTFLSCSSEESAIADTSVKALPESARTPEVLAFQSALVKQLRQQNTNKGVNDQNSIKAMNDNEDLIDAASTFLQANGSPVANRKSESNAVILSKALKVLAEKTKMTSNN